MDNPQFSRDLQLYSNRKIQGSESGFKGVKSKVFDNVSTRKEVALNKMDV